MTSSSAAAAGGVRGLRYPVGRQVHTYLFPVIERSTHEGWATISMLVHGADSVIRSRRRQLREDRPSLRRISLWAVGGCLLLRAFVDRRKNNSEATTWPREQLRRQQQKQDRPSLQASGAPGGGGGGGEGGAGGGMLGLAR
ncbi:uncharacterized protein [Penaeus vannamei]|uniref:uncharacterized protein n=1 Tax=Penaeus vannamei TaxID=6689 RepID=UPI000F67E62C|nr:uncharacterized protein LOC113830139 [Penaeus vannamei]